MEDTRLNQVHRNMKRGGDEKNVEGNYDANRECKYAAVEYGCLKPACSFRKRTSCSQRLVQWLRRFGIREA